MMRKKKPSKYTSKMHGTFSINNKFITYRIFYSENNNEILVIKLLNPNKTIELLDLFQ